MAVVTTLAAVASSPLAAESAQIERAEAKAIEGKAFFQSGLFDKAAESYMAAFVISRKPDTLFNAARANEEAGKLQEAIALFEMYVKLPDAKDAGKADARERIAKLKARLPSTPAVAAQPPPSAPAAAAPPPAAANDGASAADAPADAHSAPPKPVPVKEPAAPVAAERSVVVAGPSRPLSYGLLAGGALLTVAAVGIWADAYGKANDAQQMDFGVPDAAAVYRQKVSNAEGQRNRGVVLGVLGAGLAGWGAWRLWGTSSQSTSTGWWWAPAVRGDGAEVAVGGRF